MLNQRTKDKIVKDIDNWCKGKPSEHIDTAGILAVGKLREAIKASDVYKIQCWECTIDTLAKNKVYSVTGSKKPHKAGDPEDVILGRCFPQDAQQAVLRDELDPFFMFPRKDQTMSRNRIYREDQADDETGFDPIAELAKAALIDDLPRGCLAIGMRRDTGEIDTNATSDQLQSLINDIDEGKAPAPGMPADMLDKMRQKVVDLRREEEAKGYVPDEEEDDDEL